MAADPTTTPCLSCVYLAGEAERQRTCADVLGRLAAARLVQLQAMQAEVEILRQLNESLCVRIAAQSELLARRAERN